MLNIISTYSHPVAFNKKLIATEIVIFPRIQASFAEWDGRYVLSLLFVFLFF